MTVATESVFGTGLLIAVCPDEFHVRPHVLRRLDADARRIRDGISPVVADDRITGEVTEWRQNGMLKLV